MGKPIKCRLLIHTRTTELDWGEFPSISKAKQYVKDCDIKVYTIKRIN